MMRHRKHIRIFVGSPGDVSKERDVLDLVVKELNETIAFYSGFWLELLRWETHCVPDFGRTQGIVHKQIGPFDIFIGIMWKRFGTPTGHAQSGTEEEFRIAYEAWHQSGVPRILFYFCQEPFMPRNVEELDQCRLVLSFRRELEQKGLVWEYPGHDKFADVIRPHIAKLLLKGVDLSVPFESKPVFSSDELSPLWYFETER